MKNRLLPLSMLVIIVGVATVLLSAKVADYPNSDGDDLKTAEAYLNKVRSNQLTGAINPADVLQAREQAEIIQNSGSRAFEFDWKLRGPNNMGGRTRALMFSNQDPSGMTIYAGSVMGGLYKSGDGGNSWMKINEATSALNVTCLAQTSNGDIFAGTGEGFSSSEYYELGYMGYEGGFMGHGIFKSTDGDNFNLLSATEPTETEWNLINELAVNTSDVIFAATNAGLKYSADGGTTWMTATTPEGALLETDSKEVHVTASGIVIAEINNLCYISEDGSGTNFVLHSGEDEGMLPNENVGRIEFASAPSDANIMYAAVVNSNGGLLNVYRSNTAGADWYVIGPGGSTAFNVFGRGNDVDAGEGIYTCEIVVFPNDPDHVLLGGINQWRGVMIDDGFFDWYQLSIGGLPSVFPMYLPEGQHKYVFRPNSSDSCYIATNGGISLGVTVDDAFEYQLINRDYIGGQFYTVAYSNNDEILCGGGQDLGTIKMDGLLNTSNKKRGVDIWTTAGDIPDGIHGGSCAYSMIYPEAVFYSKTAPPEVNAPTTNFRRNEFGGGVDWALDFLPGDYDNESFNAPFVLWETFTDMDSGVETYYAANQDIDAGTEIWVQSENNRDFKYVTEEFLAKDDTLWVNDPIQARLLIGGHNMLMMSRQAVQFDVVPEWMLVSDLDHSGLEGNVNAIGISADGNHAFVGTIEGKLYRISNLKYAYDFDSGDVNSPYCVVSTTEVPLGENNQVITSIAFDPNDNNKAVVTLGNYGNENYVYRTKNALDPVPEFTSIQGDLPKLPVFASLIEMDAENNLVILGTEMGVFTSTNSGSGNPTWVKQNNNIGNVPVFQLKQQMVRKTADTLYLINVDTTMIIIPGTNNYGVIYGATYGHGLISLKEFQKPVGIDDIVIGPKSEADFRLYPNPVLNGQVTVAFETDNTSSVEIQVFDLQGRNILTKKLGTLAKGSHEVTIHCEGFVPGTYIIMLTKENHSTASKLIVY